MTIEVIQKWSAKDSRTGCAKVTCFFRERLRQKGSAIRRAKVSQKIHHVFAKDRMTERLREPAGESFAKDNFFLVKNGRFVFKEF